MSYSGLLLAAGGVAAFFIWDSEKKRQNAPHSPPSSPPPSPPVSRPPSPPVSPPGSPPSFLRPLKPQKGATKPPPTIVSVPVSTNRPPTHSSLEDEEKEYEEYLLSDEFKSLVTRLKGTLNFNDTTALSEYEASLSTFYTRSGFNALDIPYADASRPVTSAAFACASRRGVFDVTTGQCNQPVASSDRVSALLMSGYFQQWAAGVGASAAVSDNQIVTMGQYVYPRMGFDSSTWQDDVTGIAWGYGAVRARIDKLQQYITPSGMTEGATLQFIACADDDDSGAFADSAQCAGGTYAWADSQ